MLEGATPVILPPDGDMGDYLASLESLLELPLRHLAPGHGGLIESPHEEIRKLIRHRRQREAKVERGLAATGGGSLEELVTTVYDDVDPAMHPWACRTLLAHLEKLRREGRARRSGEQWLPS